jgi:predicted dehydrogenase
MSADERSRLSTNLFQDPDLLPLSDRPVADTNPISEEHDDFAEAIRQRRPPRVDGRQALQAITIAERILSQIGAGSPAVTVPFTPPTERRKAG